MHVLLDSFQGTGPGADAQAHLTFWEQLLHVLFAGLLGALVAYRPWRYFVPQIPAPERQTADTQVMIAVAGAIMVTIIGDSVARAFGLVGLGAMVRFRSSIRDTRDAALMFMMIAVGMSSGLGLLAMASTVAAVAGGIMVVLEVTGHGPRCRLKVRVDEPRAALNAIRVAFPTARVLEAPYAKVMGPGASTVVVELDGEAHGRDAAALLDLLRDRGVPGVRAVALDGEDD